MKGYKAYRRAIGGITLVNRFSNRWENRLTLFGRGTDSYERRPFNNLDDGTWGGGLREKLTYHGDRWDALLGMEWMSDAYRWEMELDGELINKNRERRNHTNFFGMVYWRPDDRWNVSLGGAVNKVDYRLTDLFSENGDQSGRRSFPLIFSPRIGVNYAPSSQLALYASAGHGFSMPSPEETLLPEGDINESLKPEQGMQYEAGVRLSLFNNATRLETAVYRIDLDDLKASFLIPTPAMGEFELFAGVNNLTNTHYSPMLTVNALAFGNAEPRYYYPGMPRHYYAGINWQF